MDRFASPSRNVENSLDEVINVAEAGLSALERVKRSARSTAESRQQYAEAKQMYSPELYQPRRASSAPRGAQSGKNVAFDEEGLYEQKRDDISVERRFEAFLRKQKLMEDRLKRLEQQKVADVNAAQALQQERDKLLEDQKADRKTILQLRSQLSALKTRVDAIAGTEESREQHSTSASYDAGANHNVADLVRTAVAAEMHKAIGEITARVIREQALNQTNKSQLNDSKILNRSAGVEQFTSLERETIRLTAEFERLKTRQSGLETAYGELKNSASARELKAEEAHKRSIHAHRVEVETFLGSAARRTAESLVTVQQHTQELAALRADVDGFTERAGNALAELDVRIGFHDQSKEEVYSVLERVEGDVMQLKNQMADVSATIGRFLEDSLQLAKVTATVEGLTRQISVVQQRLETVEVQVQATASAQDAQAVPIDMLAKSIDGLHESLSARTDALRASIDANKAHADETTASLGDALKKTKGRVKELSETIKGVSAIRQSIEAVLQEVDNRAKQDASWTYSFKTALQRVEGRLQAVEQTLVHRGGDVGAVEVGDLRGPPAAAVAMDLDHVGGDAVHTRTDRADSNTAAAAPLQHRPVPLLGTQFDEIRALIADLRQEVKRSTQAECAEIRDALTAETDEKLRALEETLHSTMETERAHQEGVEASLRSAMLEVSEDVAALRQQVAAVESRADESATAATEALAAVKEDLQAQQAGVVSRLGAVEETAAETQRTAGASALEATAELRATVDTLAQRIDRQEQHTLETGAQLKTHIGLIDELHTSLGQAQAILEAHEARVNELSDGLEAHQATLQEYTEQFAAQLQSAEQTFSEQCGILQDDLHTVKEDLSEHVTFTSDSLSDLQSALEEGLADVRTAVQEQGEAVDAVKVSVGVNQDLTMQVDAKLRALIMDLDVKVTQGHTLLERSITDVEGALRAADVSGKSRMAGTEKRLASQEAAMKERVIALEVKVGSVEEMLRTKVASMEGSLASQEEQLRESVPIEMARLQDAAVDQKLRTFADEFRTQVLTVKERVTEVEGRMAMQEGELGNVRATVEKKVGEYLTAVNATIAEHQAAQRVAMESQSEELLQTVENRSAGLRELVYQMHEIINADRDTASEAIQAALDRIAAAESSIEATDALLSDHVNATNAELAILRDDIASRAVTRDVLAVVAEVQTELAEQGTAATEATAAVSQRLAAFEEDCSRRVAELDLKLTAQQATTRNKWAEFESRLDDQDDLVASKLAEAATAQSEEQERVMALMTELEERVNAATEGVGETVQTSQETLLQRVHDAHHLLQMQEKRLRAVEKGVDAHATDAAQLTADLRLQLTDRIAALHDSLNKVTASQRESTSTLTTQLVALQGQLNDHTDEVRAAIDSEISALKAQFSADFADFSAAATGATRVEEWVTDLQRAHDDHLEHYEAAVVRQDERLQGLEGTLAGLQRILTGMNSPPDTSALTATAEAVTSAVQDMRSELAAVESATKQRFTALEQRLVRQEAQVREKNAEFAQQLAQQTADSTARLTSAEHRLDAVEAAQEDVTAVLTRLDEIEGKINTHASATDAKIQEVQAFIDEQVRALQQTHISAPTQQVQPTRTAGANTQRVRPSTAPAAGAADRTSTQQSTHSATSGSSSSGAHAFISPVKKRLSAERTDLLNERVELTMLREVADAFELHGFGNLAEDGADGDGEGAYEDVDGPAAAAAGGGNDDEEQDPLNRPVGEVRMSQGHVMPGRRPVSHRYVRQEQQPQGQQRHRYDAKHDDDEAYEQDFEEDEQVGEEEQEGPLSDFHHLMETVNFDIDKLGSHLKSLHPHPPPTSAPAVPSPHTQAREQERQDRERQEAVEGLQLKKLKHRRKFQEALFGSGGDRK